MKAIAFDFDGTLIDSMGMWRELGKNYLEKQGIEYTPQIAKDITTMSLSMSAQYFKEKFNFEESVDEIYDEMGQILFEGYSKTLELKDNVYEILDFYQEKGYPIVLATATNEKLVQPALDRYDLNKYFEWVQTCDNSGFQKSDLRFYHKITNRLDLPVDKIIFYDDAPYALKAAKESGFYTVGVSDKHNQNVWKQVVENSDETIQSFKDHLEK